MQRIPITKNNLPDRHWLVFQNENGDKKHVDLSGCAGSFERSTGYRSQDGLRAVGWRYEEGGQLCYELFNIGHTVMYASLRPGPVTRLLCLLRGQDPQKAQEAFLASFENALHAGGWKTVPKDEVAQ